MIQSNLPFGSSATTGFRLQKIEVLNWGTFDGQIYRASPGGDSTLLIGKNGSGKSTLVDALLTLLVRPGVRNFNVAAGAKKRERDEKSYLLGAYDRSSDDDSQSIRVKHLRPKGDSYSVLLAFFHNADIEKSFTVAQVLYLASDQSVEKVYCFTDDERSIQTDFGELQAAESILKILKQRGVRATRTFQEYEGWFNKATHVKSKAMEVFNQTVAVKDIQKLNDFIRSHMLEAHDWSDKVERLLGHFMQLNEAHDCLVRARQQRDLLEPVARFGEEYRIIENSIRRIENLQNAAPAYEAQRAIDLFTPLMEKEERELKEVRSRLVSIADETARLRSNHRWLLNQIDNVGGDRLKLIPALIGLEEVESRNKHSAFVSFQDSLATIGIESEMSNAEAFVKAISEFPERKSSLESESEQVARIRSDLAHRQITARSLLVDLRAELTGLERRRDNMPEWCVQMRKSISDALGIAIGEIPFAAELMQVRADERDWESSIEKVLHGLALSLLVPDRFYPLIASHMERTRLIAQGHGQRLVYQRVTDRRHGRTGGMNSPQSLVEKLDLRDRHPLLPWLKIELSEHFDFRCCESIDEFRSFEGQAMTQNRHVKYGKRRHEKDDRDRVVDPRNFVLGWDNRDKKRRLAEEIQRLSTADSVLTGEIDQADRQYRRIQRQLTAIEEAQRITNFDQIDFPRHDVEIARLKEEQQAIESQSNELQTLKRHLQETEALITDLELEKDELIGDERERKNSIDSAQKAIANAERCLDRWRGDGSLAQFLPLYEEIDEVLREPPVTAFSLFERLKAQIANWHQVIEQQRKNLTESQNRLTTAMSKFLGVCPEKTDDLSASSVYLDAFLDLRQQILEDDLPRHEQRFKERLNQKVIEEIGLFRNSLEQERRGIEGKIELLNVSLKKLEYRSGTHIELQPRPMRDSEISDFQSQLRECIEGSFEDTAEANEARFLRIKKLIVRLRDEESKRWRDKVTDVRRWFDFVAAVIDQDSGKTVSVYQDSSGQSGGEKAKLAFTILVAAIAYQYDLEPDLPVSDRFHFVVVDEMFSKVDDQHAEYALNLFRQFGLQLLIVAPLDAKARVTQPYVGRYLHVVKKENRSAIYEMTATEFDEVAEASQSYSKDGAAMS
ncbi:ATP-binding protein [Blastopirellula marina]|uniref:Chromosome partition protein Smc n=1 Tax=Blastopirellula marina DSM 3645 TaxID=314230 RepID=A3ZZA8_9BACT|nr:ATP-binding protein [Blastopirellula marina]EAQ78159.1 hypothetical protein DSM3645_15320 [Blastopirellula marina DSM 3645]